MLCTVCILSIYCEGLIPDPAEVWCGTVVSRKLRPQPQPIKGQLRANQAVSYKEQRTEGRQTGLGERTVETGIGLHCRFESDGLYFGYYFGHYCEWVMVNSFMDYKEI